MVASPPHRRRLLTLETLEDRSLLAAVITVTSSLDTNARDAVLTLREAILISNRTLSVNALSASEQTLVSGTPDAASRDTIAFNLPTSDGRHLYYSNNNAGGVSLANVATTTAADDASITDIDPNWNRSWYSIQPTSALPDLTDPVLIDGYTQSGATPNTLSTSQGLNSVLKIEISGESAGQLANGLLNIAQGDGTIIRGVVLNRTVGPKIMSSFDATSVSIEGSYLGPDISGTREFPLPTTTLPSSLRTNAIFANSPGTKIGGSTAAERNLISGNNFTNVSSNGAVVVRSFNVPAIVRGNLIGTDRSGAKLLGNAENGVVVDSPNGTYTENVVTGSPTAIAATSGSADGVTISNNKIGTNAAGTAKVGTTDTGIAFSFGEGNVVSQNTIAFTQNGISVGNNGRGIFITQNSMYSNGQGINLLGLNNVDKNDVPPDSTPPDQDSGGNGVQNYPVLTSVSQQGSNTQIIGTLASTPNSNFRIEFFGTDERSETAVRDFGIRGEYAEGKVFLGFTEVTTNAAGNASFNVVLPVDLPNLAGGVPFVTSTATDVTLDAGVPRNNTSEFSAVAVLGGLSTVVTNTGDRGLGTMREAIFASNLQTGTQTITFAIPANDPGHVYYLDDNVADDVSLANITATTAANDSSLPSNVDPDWQHSWFTIQLTRALPQIIDSVTIDGYSQAGSSANTLVPRGPFNNVLKIEIDGSNVAEDAFSLRFGGEFGVDFRDASNSVIRGLAINSFGGNGFTINTLNAGVQIAGNFIGLDPAGRVNLGNGGHGVLLNNEDGDLVGGPTPADRNLISGNLGYGVYLASGSGNQVRNNVFNGDRLDQAFVVSPSPAVGMDVGTQNTVAQADGLQLTQRSDLGNIQEGSFPISPHEVEEIKQNINSSIFDGEQLAIFFKVVFGVQISPNDATSAIVKDVDVAIQQLQRENDVSPAPSSSVLQLQAAASTEYLGIDLGGDGVTPNDSQDVDDGPSGLQNFPVLTSASTVNGTTIIAGTLNSTPNASFRIELYASSYDTSVIRAGERSLGTVDVTTNAQGNASFTFTSPTSVPVGQNVISLATRLFDRDNNPNTPLQPVATSEFSEGIPVTATVANVPPVIHAFSVPAVGAGRPDVAVNVSASFIDGNAGDTHTAIINWGDGQTSPGIVNQANNTVTGSHAYAQGGIYKVTITVADNSSAEDTATDSIGIQGARLVRKVLQVVGTASDDVITVNRLAGNVIRYQVRSGTSKLLIVRATQVRRIILSLGNGNDRATIAASIKTTSLIEGGDGNDVLRGGGGANTLRGGNGNDRLFGRGGQDRLLGENGNDLLSGGGARDLLIGGAGRDLLRGGADEDILIAGTTSYDNNQRALDQLLAVWGGSGSYNARRNTLTTPSNNAARLIAVAPPSGTVLDDGIVDTLFGQKGRDWLFASTASTQTKKDVLEDKAGNETLTQLPLA